MKCEQDVEILQLRYPNQLHFLEIHNKDVQNNCENGITIHQVIFTILIFLEQMFMIISSKRMGQFNDKVFER